MGVLAIVGWVTACTVVFVGVAWATYKIKRWLWNALYRGGIEVSYDSDDDDRQPVYRPPVGWMLLMAALWVLFLYLTFR